MRTSAEAQHARNQKKMSNPMLDVADLDSVRRRSRPSLRVRKGHLTSMLSFLRRWRCCVSCLFFLAKVVRNLLMAFVFCALA